MLYRASVKDLKDRRITKRTGHIAVVMQYYPRFVPKEGIDEYLRTLAPDRELFTEFKARARELKDHNRAFAEVEYEKRFQLSGAGKEDLKRLSALSKERDVFLVCQCASLDRCHADLLLLLARHWFQVPTQTPRSPYPHFLETLK